MALALVHLARHEYEYAATQPYRNPDDLERLLGRLREAGLED
jgi:hypothetical protein